MSSRQEPRWGHETPFPDSSESLQRPQLSNCPCLIRQNWRSRGHKSNFQDTDLRRRHQRIRKRILNLRCREGRLVRELHETERQHEESTSKWNITLSHSSVMWQVFESQILSDEKFDAYRFMRMIQNAIDEGIVKEYKSFIKWSDRVSRTKEIKFSFEDRLHQDESDGTLLALINAKARVCILILIQNWMLFCN